MSARYTVKFYADGELRIITDLTPEQIQNITKIIKGLLLLNKSIKTTATEVKPCDFYDYTMLDGYTWAEVQAKRGYRANPSFGEWPYNIIANGRNSENETYVIKEYTEHDIKTWIYSNNDEGQQEYTNHLNQLHADACEGLEGSIDGYRGIA